jgi:hypothetical protein
VIDGCNFTSECTVEEADRGSIHNPTHHNETQNFQPGNGMQHLPETSESASSTSCWDTDDNDKLGGCRCSILWDNEVDDGVDMRKLVALFKVLVLRNDLEVLGGVVMFEVVVLRSEKQPISSITDETPPDGIVLKSMHILLAPVFFL